MIQLTITGRKIDPWNVRPEDVDPHDIAGALSKQARFAGHTTFHYPVAQHCLMVADVLHPLGDVQLELAGLLHDAAEAYLVDVPSPVKHDPRMHHYRTAEARAQESVARRFGIDWALFDDPRLKRADLIAMATEVRDLLPKPVPPEWYPELQNLIDYPPLPLPIRQTYPPAVEYAFLSRLLDLRDAWADHLGLPRPSSTPWPFGPVLP